MLIPFGIAQESSPARVPSLIKHSGVLKDRMGRAMREIVGLTFLIYRDGEGGTPLWMETQNVRPEPDGSYSAILGATKDLPLDLFASGEPRWVGVQINLPGEEEQARIQLVSVPFALKAADAETLGGKPLSAFVLTPEAAKSAQTAGPQTGGQAIATVLPTAAVQTTNYLQKFDGSPLTNSLVFDNGTSVGVNNSAPITALDVTGTIRAVNHQNAPYGTYLMPNGGAANSFRFGFGNNLYFDGANWRTKGDTVNNSGSAMLTDMGTGQLAIFTVPPAAGGADQVISNAGFDAYEKMRITAAGKVGIGSTNPATALDVSGTIRAVLNAAAPFGTYLMPTGGAANDFRFGFGNNLYFDSANWRTKGDGANNAGSAMLTNIGTGELAIFTLPTTGATDQVISNAGFNAFEKVRITSDGKVGIGTTGPEQKLHVNGSIRLTGNVGGQNPDGITFPDGTKQTSACGILFGANGRARGPGGVTPAGGGALSECSAAASLQSVVQEQRVQIQRLQSELEGLKQRLDALVGAKQ